MLFLVGVVAGLHADKSIDRVKVIRVREGIYSHDLRTNSRRGQVLSLSQVIVATMPLICSCSPQPDFLLEAFGMASVRQVGDLRGITLDGDES